MMTETSAPGGTRIHPTSFVEKGAQLGAGVEVGPFCTVSAGARIGDRTRLISHVVIAGEITLGPDNVVHPFAALGGEPQDLTYKQEPTRVVIGSRNTLREGVTIHRGTAKDRGETTIGDQNYIMAYSHVAHDCVLGNQILMANQTALAGHVQIGDHAVIGGLSAIVQKCRVGAYAFLGGMTIMRRDLPPFMAAKEFSQVSGPNLVGLRRKGIADTDVRVISELYKIFYLGNLKVEKAIEEIETRFASNVYAKSFVEFLKSSKAGVQR
jgi:UDP-N-acetylglucosamine acyltransferase